MLMANIGIKSHTLLSNVCGCNIAGAGLITQHSRWINHPQTATEQGNNFPTKFTHAGIRPAGESLFGGDGLGAKRLDRKAPAAPSLFGADLRLPDPPFVSYLNKGYLSMIYSFLIAPQTRKLSELSPSRTVICHASSLKQARASFAGLSVAMTSRKPEQGGASQ